MSIIGFNKTAPIDTLDKLMREAFPTNRPARSTTYIDGARRLLQFQLKREPLTCPHLAGTTSYDAFQAGVAEGREIWALHLARAEKAAASRNGIASRNSRHSPANAADMLAAELLHAELIILMMLRNMTPGQKAKASRELDEKGVIGADGGMTRYHERRAALIATGFAEPEPIGTHPCAHAFDTPRL